MKTLRLALSAFVLLGLVAGYLASQYAYFNGTAPDYAQRVDQPSVRYLALAILLIAIVFSFVKDQEKS